MLARLLHPLLQEHCITIFRLSPEAKAQVREAFLAALRVRLAGSAAEPRPLLLDFGVFVASNIAFWSFGL